MANRYDFSDERKKIEIPLTKQVSSGQIWRSKQSGIRIFIDGPSSKPEVWNAHTSHWGSKVETQVQESTLLIDYERVQ